MVDLSKTSLDKLSGYQQVWAFSTDEMNAKDQQLIVDYTKEGGNLVLFPYLPDREMSQKPCTIIRDAFSITPSGSEVIDSPLIDIYGFEDIKCANPQIIYSEETLKGAEVIARTINGSACGFSKNIEKGNVIHVGTWLGFDTEGHKPVYEHILTKSKALLTHASANNEDIIVRERFTNNKSGLLFIGNYYNEEKFGKVTYTHPVNGEEITIPYSKNDTLWPATYGVLTPLCIKVSDSISILHSTSDILGIEETKSNFNIILQGDRDLIGELVLEGDIQKIKSAKINGENVKIDTKDNRIILSYNHKHKTQVVISIVKE